MNGADIEPREQLEESIIVEYGELETPAYRTETERAVLEYREGLF